MVGVAFSPIEKKPVVERVVPKPVRRLFRTMNLHFTEHGRVINRLAKTLPPEERKQVVEHGKDFCVARSKKNVPIGFRNVAASLAIGQGMWYLGCPLLSKIPGITDSAWGWLAWGGSDKLFIAADQMFFTTDMVGGYSSTFAGHLANAVPKTVGVGSLMLGIELATDFSRCWIEYWTQKRYGIVADGAARLYGQSRPFPVRYSSFEAYQKIISYALRPFTIGTAKQIYSSIQGFMGSLWRTGPQLGLVVTLGRAIDRFFGAIAEWTGLRRLGERMKEKAQQREDAALAGIAKVVGPERSLALNYMLAADSRMSWKWNPFKPALAFDKAMEAARATLGHRQLASISEVSGSDAYEQRKGQFLQALAGNLEATIAAFGFETLDKIPGFKSLALLRANGFTGVENQEQFMSACRALSFVHGSLMYERQLS